MQPLRVAHHVVPPQERRLLQRTVPIRPQYTRPHSHSPAQRPFVALQESGRPCRGPAATPQPSSCQYAPSFLVMPPGHDAWGITATGRTLSVLTLYTYSTTVWAMYRFNKSSNFPRSAHVSHGTHTQGQRDKGR